MPEDQFTIDLTPMVGHPFARFVEQMQRQTMVNSNLEHLLERHQLTPVMLLYFIWFGQQAHGRLRRVDYRRLQQALSHWHEHIVGSLEHLQNTARQSQRLLSSPLQTWLSTELEFARMIECRLLADAVVPLKTLKRSNVQRLNDVSHNIVNFTKIIPIHFDDDDQHALSLLIQAAFPECNAEQIANSLQFAFTSNKANVLSYTQLSLDMPFQ